MRRLTAFLALALMVLAPAANAQVVLGVVNTGTPTYATGESRPFQLNADGTLKVGPSAGSATGVAQGSATSGQTGVLTQCSTTTTAPTYVTATTNPINCSTRGGQRVEGIDLSGSTATGAPVGIGCTYLLTPATYTNGQRSDCLSDANGNLRARLVGASSTTYSGLTGSSGFAVISGPSAQGGGIPLAAVGFVYNGTNLDANRSVQGANGTGLGVQAANPVPVSDATGGLVSVRNTAVGSAQVLKAAAGNLYDWQVTSGASAGYVLIFNATTAPADGAVTPAQCVAVAANTTVGSGMNVVPEYFSTGITVVFSTTGCFTKTASATAFIRGRAQ